MTMSRTKNSLRNIAISLLTYLIIVLLQFINRVVFVKCLPVEYLGMNGLFSNVLSLLSLTELGIGTSIAYSLYKPLKKKDYETIKSIMFLYRRLYIGVGSSILGLGAILTLFLNIFISEIPDFISLNNIRIYYFLYVINTCFSYLGSYKRTLLLCDQKQYITSIITAICKILLTVMQVIELIFSKNYGGYLFLLIIGTLLENILLTIISNKRYPFLKEKNVNKLNIAISQGIKKNIYAMFFHRIGDVVVNASDNLIITRFASLTLTGLFSNYMMIINALRTLPNQVFSAMTASVGDLLSEGTGEKDKSIFFNILFLNFVIYSYCTLCLAILINEFVGIWLGKGYLLEMATVIVICYSFYFTGMLKTVRIFRDAAGVFYYDRYKPIAEAAINIIISIPLTQRYQIFGTIIGTIASCLLVSFWIEGYVLFKNCFKGEFRIYIYYQMRYLFVFTSDLVVCLLLCKYIPTIFGVTLVIRLALLSFVYLVTIRIVFRNVEGYGYFKNLFKYVIYRK